MRPRLSKQEFIEKANNVHKHKFDYTYSNYVNAFIKIKIVCPIHGEFEQIPSNHLRGSGCSLCSSKKKHNYDTFINKSNMIHNNKYDYSKVLYTSSRSKVIIICPKHGEFNQTPVEHMRGRGCSKCYSSKGEQKIEQWLIVNNFKFETQKRFKECRNKLPLPFDFYLPENNTCIEYDGWQHFMPHSFKKEDDINIMLTNYKNTILHDEIKTKFCIDNNIKLVRISYKDDYTKDGISIILSNILLV